MNGHWQRDVPTKDGRYWTATRQGDLVGVQVVAYSRGELVYAGAGCHGGSGGWWSGWWWSQPVEEPPKPTGEF